MVSSCSVVNCQSRVSSTMRCYSLPSGKNSARKIDPLKQGQRQKWLAAIRRKTLPKRVFVCQRHFIMGAPSDDPIHPDFVPSLQMGYVSNKPHRSPMKSPSKARLERRERLRRRLASQDVSSSSAMHGIVPTLTLRDEVVLDDVNPRDEELVVTNASPVHDLESENSDTTLSADEEALFEEQNEIPTPVLGSTVSIGVQTYLGSYTEFLQSKVKALEMKLKLETIEKQRIKESYNSIIPNYESLKKDDSTVLYLTGLPSFKLIDKVFHFLKDAMKPVKELSCFQVFILTLMKLRKNYDFRDLGLRFGIHRTTASKYYHATLVVLYYHLKCFVTWRSREQLQRGMPSCFTRSFGKRVVIVIDCFECRIETPAALLAQYQTWSSYKHHNTVKFLIGIAPQGAITFISKAYGGHAADTFIVEDCGVLDNLLPNDLIMSDKGFSIVEEVQSRGAELKQPAFKKKGVAQMPKDDVARSREISSSRVHVERIIGSLRQKYEILQQEKFSISLLDNFENQEVSHLDMVVTVCCALVNLCPTIIEPVPVL